jgi:hypothetical protein
MHGLANTILLIFGKVQEEDSALLPLTPDYTISLGFASTPP